MNNKKHQQKLAKRKEHNKRIARRSTSGYYTYLAKKQKQRQSPEITAEIAKKLGLQFDPNSIGAEL